MRGEAASLLVVPLEQAEANVRLAFSAGKVALRLRRPFEVVRLGELMEILRADLLHDFGYFLGFASVAKVNEEILISEDARISSAKLLNHLSAACELIGLTSCSKMADRIVNRLKSGDLTYGEYGQLAKELENRWTDERDSITFFFLPAKSAQYWQGPQLFGPEVADRFPSANYDIEEAGKCLACQRGTAAVFHLMRVMEAGLKAVAAKMDVPYAPSWESYIKQLTSLINREWKDKEPEWRVEERFFSEVLAHLGAVKIAWRNSTMHLEKTYTQEQAEDIFGSVRSFMRHLATNLSE